MMRGLVLRGMTAATAAALLIAACSARVKSPLDAEKDPAELEQVATTIVQSGSSAAMADLADHLAQPAFLARLDPPPEMLRLESVFRAMAEHPTPGAEKLCMRLAREQGFGAVPARLNLLLGALAAARPMSPGAAQVFRETGRSGFIEVNVPLLARNGSPQATSAFEDLMADESIDAAQRVSAAHYSIVPYRTQAGLVTACTRLLARRGLSREVRVGVVESLYDFQSVAWFGRRGESPTPPPWASAPPATRTALRSLAATLLGSPDLSSDLRAAIRASVKQLR